MLYETSAVPTPALLPPALARTLSEDDYQVLTLAHTKGQVSASLFRHGEFSEDGFLLYGRLEGLASLGLLRFESWSGDSVKGEGDVDVVFTPVERHAA